MKRFFLATLVALALAAISEQKAQAWFNFGIGGSANTNISWGGLNVSCHESEPWPIRAYGLPQYNMYGPSNSGPPAYPVNPYGMQTYGATNGYGPPPPPQAPVAPGQGSGSGAPMSYNYAPQQPQGYGFAAPYGYAPPMMPYAPQPTMPYASQAVYRPAPAYPTQGYYYGR
jgi:hypothetical protein